jgi:hypothetical protein
MAYARFAPDSDVYAYRSVMDGAHVCCACKMRIDYGDERFRDPNALRLHLIQSPGARSSRAAVRLRRTAQSAGRHMSRMMTIDLPVKLNDQYTCQGRQPDGTSVFFEDLCTEGERVATRSRGDDVFGPYGIVVKREDGLWIVPEEEIHEQKA